MRFLTRVRAEHPAHLFLVAAIVALAATLLACQSNEIATPAAGRPTAPSAAARSSPSATVARPIAPAAPSPSSAAAAPASPRPATRAASPVAGAASPAAASPGPGRYANPDLLADVEWLVARIDDPNLRIIALTPKDEFDRGHLPGAVQIDWPDLQVTDTADPAIEKWRGEVEQKLGARGIAPDNSVVIYDGGTLYAARPWWILDQLGHREKRVLNGGLPAWALAGKPIVQEPTSVVPTTYRGQPDASKLATLTEVRASLNRPDVVLVDARTSDEFAAGHIPGAVNVNFPENARPTDPKFWKAATELEDLYRPKGITPDKLIIPYCSTGVRSAVTFFTLKLLGYPNVKLYTGSWDEWQSHPELPRATGP